MAEVRFDDLAALGALVSEQFGPFGKPLAITQEMIDAFAELTGDRQWIHVDVERCRRESPFGAPVAHGFLVLSLVPALAGGEETKIVGHASVIHYGTDKLRFTSPVPAGSRVHARRRIAHVRKKGVGGTQLTFETEVWVVGAEQPCLLYRSLALFMP